MRVVFFGNCPDYSLNFVSALVMRSLDPDDRVQLVGVVCPQRFESRIREAMFTSKRRVERVVSAIGGGRFDARFPGHAGPWHRMHQLAQRAGALITWPASTGERTVRELISKAAPDVVLVGGLDRIPGVRTLAALPPVFNIHPSMLPDYRGGVPEFWQLADGATSGGVTLHRITEGIDEGPIVLQQRFTIEPWFDAAALIAASIGPGLDLMNQFLDVYPDIAETVVPKGQGSYQPLPSEADRAVPFDVPAHSAFNRARAAGWDAPLVVYVPADWSGDATMVVHTPTDETLTLRVRDPIPFAGATGDGPPGTIARVPGGGVIVACNPGFVFFRHVEVCGCG
jgi:methionyl-tRNA formyltransferase